MCAWLFDIALSTVFNRQRFDVGFYAGRLYGLSAATFILIVLLIRTRAALRQALAAARHRADRAPARKRDAAAHLRHLARPDHRSSTGAATSAQVSPSCGGDPGLSPGGDGRAQSAKRVRSIPTIWSTRATRCARPAAAASDAQFRLPLRPQGRPHRAAGVERRVVGARPAALLHRPRHDRAHQARAAAAPGAEDGGDRPADRRHRPRLQQHPDRHHRHDRAAGRRRVAGDPQAGADGRRRSTRPPSAARS